MLDAVRGPLPSALVRGVYLYGSAVVGGLRPDSNLDVLAVVDRALTASERRALVEGLVPISSRALRPDAWRPVELTVVVRGAIEPWRYPPAREIQYGEWVRDELIADPDTAGPVPSPDLAILLTRVRTDARVLHGDAPAREIPAVPAEDLRRAIRNDLPGLPPPLTRPARSPAPRPPARKSKRHEIGSTGSCGDGLARRDRPRPSRVARRRRRAGPMRRAQPSGATTDSPNGTR